MADFWSFSVAGYFLPLILRAKGIEASHSTTADTYRSYVYISELSVHHEADLARFASNNGNDVCCGCASYLSVIDFPANPAQLMEVPRSGQKWAMVISAGLMGVSLAMVRAVILKIAD